MLRWAGQVPANSALLPLAICGKRCIGRKRLWISKRIHHLSYKWGFTALSSYSSFREGMYKDAGAGFLPLDVASSYVPLCRHWQLLFRGFGWFCSDEMIKGIVKFSFSSAIHLLSATSIILVWLHLLRLTTFRNGCLSLTGCNNLVMGMTICHNQSTPII